MGFLRSIFKQSRQDDAGRQNIEQNQEPETRQDGPRQREIAKEIDNSWMTGIYYGMPFTVESQENNLYFLGALTAFSPTEFSVSALSKQETLPLIRKNMPVTLRGYLKNLKPIDIAGVVMSSNSDLLRIGGLILVEHEESRQGFRLPLNVKGQLFSAEDAKLAKPIPCSVINISSGGACVVTAERFEPRSKLHLKVSLQEGAPAQVLPGIVVRHKPRGDTQTEYGLQFVPLNQQDASILVKNMFDVQRKMRAELSKKSSPLK